MEITEVRIKLMDKPEDRLRGFCSVTFDECFVIRDLKIIEGNKGPFVAMPSRKLTSNCHKCRCKNHLKSNFCNQCGIKLRDDDIEYDSNGRAKLYADIAHPINSQCREAIQSRIVQELEKEVELSRHPGYRSRYDEGYDDRTRPRNPAPAVESKSKPDSDRETSAPPSSASSPPHPRAPAEGAPAEGAPVKDQAEVETRIDMPRPSDRASFPQPQSSANVSKSSPSEHARSDDCDHDSDNAFGKGIF